MKDKQQLYWSIYYYIDQFIRRTKFSLYYIDSYHPSEPYEVGK